MRYLKIIAFCVLVIGISSCQQVCECVDSTGSPTEITVSVPPFEQINVNDKLNVYITQGNTQQLQIQGGSNLVSNITASVSGGVLTLHNKNKCDWLRNYKKSTINVYITLPRLTTIFSNGVGIIQSTDTLTADTLVLHTYGSADLNLTVHSQRVEGHLFGAGNITLSGITATLDCTFFAGTGFMYCNNLTSGYTYLSTTTTGDCYVHTTGLLIAIINQIGNVYYSGNPTIQRTLRSTGQLIQD